MINFQTIESILKLSIIRNMRYIRINFQTIESILKLITSEPELNPSAKFPDY